MINNMVLACAFLMASIHVFFTKAYRDGYKMLDVYFLYFLVAGVGVIGAIGFVGHVFFSDQVARLIGWPTGSPFQFEVGFHDGAWALLGFLCIRYRDDFWTATAIGWSFFMLGATYGHIHQTLLQGNFAPYNYGIILPDLLVPVILLSCVWLKSRQ